MTSHILIFAARATGRAYVSENRLDLTQHEAAREIFEGQTTDVITVLCVDPANGTCVDVSKAVAVEVAEMSNGRDQDVALIEDAARFCDLHGVTDYLTDERLEAIRKHAEWRRSDDRSTYFRGLL